MKRDKLPPYRVAPGHLLFYKPLLKTLDTTNGLLNIYPASHKLDRLRDEQSMKASLPTDQVVMIGRNMVIQYPCDGAGVGLRNLEDAISLNYWKDRVRKLFGMDARLTLLSSKLVKMTDRFLGMSSKLTVSGVQIQCSPVLYLLHFQDSH